MSETGAFGAWLRSCRRSAGLSQEALAGRAGLSVRAVRNLERGRTGPHLGSLHRLADALALEGQARADFIAAAAPRQARAAAIRRTPAELVLQPGQRPIVPRQLPAAVACFTGRDAELAALTRLLDAQPGARAQALVISAVAGTAGVGKTALAVHWAHQVAGRFPDGQLYVNLRGYDPGQPVPAADALAGFLRALGVAGQDIPGDADERAAAYRSLLAGRRMLVVLDNAGQVEQVRPLLPGSPGCATVATSRDALPGLVARDGAVRLDLDLLPMPEAVGLLRALIGARVDAEPEASAELAALCARLPLALRIAAELATARPAASLAGLAGELAAQQRRLDLLDAGGDPRAGIRAVFSWSYQHLSIGAARVFRLLGLHPGPDITIPAAASLAGISPLQARQALHDLAGANLVTEHLPGRFSLHDLLRGYAAEQTADSDTESEQHAARRRIFDHYLQAAHAAVKTLYPATDELSQDALEPGTVRESPDTREAARMWLATEHQVLLAVSRLAAEAGSDAYAAQLPLALATYLDRWGHWQDCADTQRAALTALERTGDLAGQARAHRFLGRALIRLGSYDTGQAHLTRAMHLFCQLGDPLGQARCHLAIAMLFCQQARHQDALVHAEDALPLYAAAGHRIGQAAALNHIAVMCLHAGDPARALACSHQALAVHRELGNTEGEAEALDTLGCASQHLRRHAEAIAYCQQAISLFVKTGNKYNQAEALTHLADAHQTLGDTGKARTTRLRALAILDSLNHPDADLIRAELGE